MTRYKIGLAIVVLFLFLLTFFSAQEVSPRNRDMYYLMFMLFLAVCYVLFLVYNGNKKLSKRLQLVFRIICGGLLIFLITTVLEANTSISFGLEGMRIGRCYYYGSYLFGQFRRLFPYIISSIVAILLLRSLIYRFASLYSQWKGHINTHIIEKSNKQIIRFCLLTIAIVSVALSSLYIIDFIAPNFHMVHNQCNGIGHILKDIMTSSMFIFPC